MSSTAAAHTRTAALTRVCTHQAASSGNQSSTRILAKSLVRVRGQQAKMHAGIAQMQGVKSGMTVRFRPSWPELGSSCRL